MSHGQVSRVGSTYKNFAAPSGTDGESVVAAWTDGVDGDDLSLFPGTGSTSPGRLNVYLGGSSIFHMDNTSLHLDESAPAPASTFWGGGGSKLGTVTNPFSMAWLNSHQIIRDVVAATTWGGAGVLGIASIPTQSVTGAAQTLTPLGQLIRLAGTGGAASVLKISAPPADYPPWPGLLIMFDDANVTMTDSGTGGAAETMNLKGANYVSSIEGVLALAWNNNPVSGNKRWVKVSGT